MDSPSEGSARLPSDLDETQTTSRMTTPAREEGASDRPTTRRLATSPSRRLQQAGERASQGTSRISVLPGDATPPAGVSSLTTVDFARLRGLRSIDHLRRQLPDWQRSTIEPGCQRYRVGDLLGQGGQGLVFEIEDRDFRRQLALKTLKKSRTAKRHIARFIHEAQVTAQLEHPGVVPVHDFSVLEDGTVFYTMKRIEGEPLSEILLQRAGAKEHRFDLLQVFQRICETMAFAHARGVVHRDLKPLNVMIGPFGEVLIVDWGLSKILGASEVFSSRQEAVQESEHSSDIEETQEGSALGTLGYMSPEQARGEQDLVDTRSDIYSLGVILYEILVGESPYGEVTTHRELMDLVNRGAWRPLLALPAGRRLPRPLSAIVHKALEADLDRRYQSVVELSDDLAAFLAGQGVVAYEESRLESLLRWIHRNRVMVRTATTVALLALLIAGAVTIVYLRQQRQRADELRQQADLAAEEGRWDDAKVKYQMVLELFPDDRTALDRRAAVAERQKIAREQARLQEDRRRAEVKGRQANEHYQAGGIDRLRQARELLTEALAMDPGNEDFRAFRARIVNEIKLIEVHGHIADGLAFIAAGRLDDAAGRLEAARSLEIYDPQIEELQKALTSARDEAVAARAQAEAEELHARARTAAQEGDYEQAVLLMKAALEIASLEGGTETVIAFTQQRDRLRQERLRAQRQADAGRELAEVARALERGDLAAARRSLTAAEVLYDDHPELDDYEERIAATERRISHHQAETVHQEALALQQQAIAEQQTISQLQRQIDELQGIASESERERRLRLSQALQERSNRRESLLQQAQRALLKAREIAPDYVPVRDSLANFYRDRVMELVARGDRAQVGALVEIGRSFDPERRYRLVFDNLARVAVAADAAPVTVRSLEDDTVIAELVPGEPREITAGSYLLKGGDGVCTAQRFGRAEQVLDLRLPPMPALPGDCAFVPPGTVYDRDGQALYTVDAGFAMQIHEVTNADWLAFLNAPSSRQRWRQIRLGEVGPSWFPRQSPTDREGIWHRRRLAVDSFLFELEADGKAIRGDAPVTHISLADIEDYIRWRREQDGIAWRLPSLPEWKLAAQSGDGRLWTWGDNADDLMRCLSGATVRRSQFLDQAVGSFPEDRTVHGIFDLAGSVSEFVGGHDTRHPDTGYVLGGSWRDLDPDRCSTWFTTVFHRQAVASWLGFRLAVDIVDGRPARHPAGR